MLGDWLFRGVVALLLILLFLFVGGVFTIVADHFTRHETGVGVRIKSVPADLGGKEGGGVD